MSGFLNVAIIVIAIVALGLIVASKWLILNKMGESGWKAVVPFVGEYTVYKSVWESKIYFLSLIPAFIEAIIMFGFWYAIANTDAEELSWFALNGEKSISFFDIKGVPSLLILFFIFGLVWMVFRFVRNWRLVKCFDLGLAFFLGITFLPVIFYPILAFGNAEYDYY